MTGADSLTESQVAAAVALVQGEGYQTAALNAKCSLATIARMKRLPAFQAYMRELQQAAADSARGALANGVHKAARQLVAISSGTEPRHQYQLAAICQVLDRMLGPTRGGRGGMMGLEHTSPDGSTYRVIVDYRDGQAPRWLSEGKDDDPDS